MGFEPIQLRVSRIVQETADVKTFRLEADSPLPFDFLAGQFIVLHFEIYDEAKGKVRRKNRAFSISSSPLEKKFLEITVRKTGFVSSFMHDALKVGDWVTVRSLGGKFIFQDGLADELVLIAGGTGVAPFRSMIRYILQKNLPVKVTLIYSSRTPSDILFREEFDALSAAHPDLRCVHTITRPRGESWRGNTGRISVGLLRRHVSNLAALFYLCGPTPMIEEGVRLLKEMGVEEGRIRLEKWD